jgi:hypothetical protein
LTFGNERERVYLLAEGTTPKQYSTGGKKMTKKDYELIADAIATARKVEVSGGGVLVSVAHLANTLATELEIENPRFNREMFLTACGVN